MKDAQLLTEMKQFEADSDLLDKSMNNLKKSFLNKFIAFKNGKVVASGCTMDELVEQSKSIDLGVCVIQFIADKETLFIL